MVDVVSFDTGISKGHKSGDINHTEDDGAKAKGGRDPDA
jgi:hypothetical protein